MPFLKLKNQLINYKIIDGIGNKPFLVFLHEGLGCIEMWKSFPEKLCRRTSCPGLLYDRTGYGKSSPLESDWTINYHFYYALDELPSVINTLIPGSDYIMIGHSDGATIALLYASEKPDNLLSMIIEAPHVFVEEKTVESIKKAYDAFMRGELDKLRKYHGNKTERIISAWAGSWTDDKFRSWNIEHILPSIEIPHLIIQGGKDRYGTEKQYKIIEEKTTGRTDLFIIPECGHSPHITYQESTLNRTAEYIKNILAQE